MTIIPKFIPVLVGAVAIWIVDSALPAQAQKTARSEEYGDFNPGTSEQGSEWVQSIVIQSPELRSHVKGDVKIAFQAPGMTVARVLCWQQPTATDPAPLGHDTVVGSEITLDAQGGGSVIFPADQYPNGPINVRVLANNADHTKKDIREIQLYNDGGVTWNQGIPKSDPPAAAGMKLVFSDDFNGPLSISHDGKGATYGSHKPGGGDFSGWNFADNAGPDNPFSQEGTFLRIHASKAAAGGKGSSGLIAPVAQDGTGVYVTPPFYMECRFTAQSAPGTWPAFWTLTKTGTFNKGAGTDELDIIEGYGGVGKGNPNHPGYSITSHFWEQKGADGQPLKPISKRIDMLELGGKSYWSTTFHTYGLEVTPTDTVYYLDDIEVLRHPTGAVSKVEPEFFMINYAIGGISGWKIDMEREGNATDMWVDFVRVYQGTATP